MTRPHAALDRAIAALPETYPGPGGAVAVLRQGQVLVRHTWGFANAEARIRFTPETLFRICSITKQFVCATVLRHFPDPSVLDADIAALLPNLTQPAPTTLQLMHNQSGLRDYWAVAMLHGSPAEAPFGETEARRVITGTRTLQFTPGTRYSYCNQNFRLLGDAVAARTGRSLAALLRTGVLADAGMETAQLAADTRALPDGTEGYEGSVASGFRSAKNRVTWTGDAGLAASLEDMIAWERHIDATRDDPAALPTRIAAPVPFADGAPASYGFGLARGREFGRATFGHGGGLRGWRSHRLYMPAERVSVVVLFNHLADAHAASLDVLAALLGETQPAPDARLPPPAWLGAWREPETVLAARVEADAPGRVRLRFGPTPEALDLAPDGSAGRDRTRLVAAADGLRLHRPQDNCTTLLQPIEGAADPSGLAGEYRCAELDAVLSVVDAGGVLHGAFSGFLGQGRMERLQPLGGDLWLLPCPRALDYAAPGDWTLAFARNGTVEVGCWLARGLRYAR
jgi:D-aminopeptidase